MLLWGFKSRHQRKGSLTASPVQTCHIGHTEGGVEDKHPGPSRRSEQVDVPSNKYFGAMRVRSAGRALEEAASCISGPCRHPAPRPYTHWNPTATSRIHSRPLPSCTTCPLHPHLFW